MNPDGERLKAAREAAGLTQEELGERVGVTGVTIMRYEKNQRQPRLKQLSRIALALNTSVSELVEPGYWDTLTPEDEENMWGPSGQQRVVTALKQMTQAGVEKVADYAEDILPRYKKDAPKQGGEQWAQKCAGTPTALAHNAKGAEKKSTPYNSSRKGAPIQTPPCK